MAKSKFLNEDTHIKTLMNAVKKFHDDQEVITEKFRVKKITLSLDSERSNPCSGKMCNQGYHPEIHINPETGEISCRCVKN